MPLASRLLPRKALPQFVAPLASRLLPRKALPQFVAPLASRLLPRKALPHLLASLAFSLSPLASSPLASQSLPRPDSAQLIKDLFVLAADSMEGRRTGTLGGQRARIYLEQRLKGLGIAPLGRDFAVPFASAGRGGDTTRGVNLVGVIPGTKNKDRFIVLSAHYDHVGVREGKIYPGADDNASGTAAVVAIAAWLKKNSPMNSVVLALFDGEDGGLRGARAFVAALPVPADAIIANINLDMVSRNDKNEIYVAGATPNPQFKPLLDATIAAVASLLVTLKHGHDSGTGSENWTNQSDQGAFAAKGIPWVYFGVEDYADYHKPTDFPDRVPQGFYYHCVQTIADFLWRLDATPPPRK